MCLSHLIYTVRPCLIHTCQAIPIQRPCHALTILFFSKPRHYSSVKILAVGYLPAYGFFHLPHGVPRRLLSEAYHSSSQGSVPTTEMISSSSLQKRRSVKLSVSSSYVSGYHSDFHEGHGSVEARQWRCMACVN